VAVIVPTATVRAGASGAENSSAEGAPDRKSGRLGVGRRNDPRLPTNATATVGAGSGRDRECRSPHQRGSCEVEQTSAGPASSDQPEAPNEGALETATTGEAATNRVTARGRRCRLRLSGVIVDGLIGWACARACVGWWSGEAVAEQARAQRPRVGRSSGCSLTTSRLQRLATGAFPSKASDVSAWQAHSWGSELGRSITVTGGWLGGAKGCPGARELLFRLSQTSCHFRPRVGMKSIKGVLGRESLSLTRSGEE